MHIHIHIHKHDQGSIPECFVEQLKDVFSSLNQIKMTTQEAVDKIIAQGKQLKKISGEVTSIKNALAESEAAGDTVPEALAAAINESGQTIQEIDDLNADAVTVDPAPSENPVPSENPGVSAEAPVATEGEATGEEM